MIKFTITDTGPVFEEDGLKLTFKRCTSKTFSNWSVKQEVFGVQNFDKDGKIKIETLTSDQIYMNQNAHVSFASHQLLKIEGLLDSETGEEITKEMLEKNREVIFDFFQMLFDQSEKFSEFFVKYKDGAEKKSDGLAEVP